MKNRRKEKDSTISNRHHKNKKKHKKKHESSSDSDSSDDKMQWVEASTISNINTFKKKKKKRKKYVKSSESDSESDVDKKQWVEASSSSKQKKNKKKHKNYESPTDSDSGDDKSQWVEASPISDINTIKRKDKHNLKKKSSSSNSESSDKETKSVSLPSTVEKRDSWMNEESFVHTLSKDEMYLSSRQKRAEAIKEQRNKEEKIQRERELNPHWKNEGTGLPEKEASVASLSLPSTSVGDGGYSWLKKAYYRIQEQAQQEGRSMEEVAIERWGSLSKLTSLIEEAEERMKNHPDWKLSKHQYRDKYDQDNRPNKMQFKKPNNYESEKAFDSPFQFRKPAEDFRNRKVLNQFKSSRKASDTSEKTDYKNSDKSSVSYKHSTYLSEEVKEVKKSNSDNRIPTWKKPKYSESKEISDHSEQQISKSPLKEIVKETDDIPITYSENDLNTLAAKQLKAEMMGDTLLAEKLQKQLDEARKTVKEKGFMKAPSKMVEKVILTKFDSQGQAWPIQKRQGNISDYKQKKSSKYFDDRSSYSLKQMFEREKLTTADDQMEMFVAASTQSNETAEIDYESGHISKSLSKKLSASREDERDIGKAIQQHKKLTASLEKCNYCLDQSQIKKHLIVHVGENVYLCLPGYQSVTEGHCLIVPKSHISSFLSLDENEWREVNDFKNLLRNMFRSDSKAVIFLETSMHFRHFPHAVLECIPVPEEEGDMAPLYFKKAIQESEAEWAHNKKLIDLTKKGLRRSVPKGLPYFYVEFDPKVHAGYAHVIEDEKLFPRNFGKEVVGGMLDIDYNYLYKNKREDPLKKANEVVDFEKKWKLFKNVK